jgi:hypothetical protein
LRPPRSSLETSGARRPPTAHGELLMHLESAGPRTARALVSPTTGSRAAPGLAALLPALCTLVCDAWAEWHREESDRIAQHAQLPAHGRLRRIALRGLAMCVPRLVARRARPECAPTSRAACRVRPQPCVHRGSHVPRRGARSRSGRTCWVTARWCASYWSPATATPCRLRWKGLVLPNCRLRMIIYAISRSVLCPVCAQCLLSRLMLFSSSSTFRVCYVVLWLNVSYAWSNIAFALTTGASPFLYHHACRLMSIPYGGRGTPILCLDQDRDCRLLDSRYVCL